LCALAQAAGKLGELVVPEKQVMVESWGYIQTGSNHNTILVLKLAGPLKFLSHTYASLVGYDYYITKVSPRPQTSWSGQLMGFVGG
jgi:hypothetical protein